MSLPTSQLPVHTKLEAPLKFDPVINIKKYSSKTYQELSSTTSFHSIGEDYSLLNSYTFTFYLGQECPIGKGDKPLCKWSIVPLA